MRKTWLSMERKEALVMSKKMNGIKNDIKATLCLSR